MERRRLVAQAPFHTVRDVDTSDLLNITVERFMNMVINPVPWQSWHESPVDRVIRTLIQIYICVHAPMMPPLSTLRVSNVMATVFIMDEESYYFTNAVEALLNISWNEFPEIRKHEKLFRKV